MYTFFRIHTILFLYSLFVFSCKSINEKETIPDKMPQKEEEIPTNLKEKKENLEIKEILNKLQTKDKKLSLKEIVQLLIQNNHTIQLQKLEIIKSDTDLIKEEDKYSPVLDFKFQSYEKIDKQLPQSIFQGTQINQDTYTIGIQKLFESGTFFRIEGSDSRFDSNSGESALALTNPILQQLKQPPLHTGTLKFIFQQDLLKNSFGYSQKRLNEIAKRKSLLQKEQLEYQLSGLIVKAIVDYWNLSIAEWEVNSAKGLLNNVNTIRNIIYQKLQFGLAEAFEVNQWNAMYNQAEIALQFAELNQETQKKELLRSLNLDSSLEIHPLTELEKELPKDINLEEDIQYALKSRQDYKAIEHTYEIARLSKELASNNLLPTVRIGGQYATRDYGRYSGSALDKVYSGKYPEKAIEFSVQYPLWNEGTKVDLRNAEITLQQIEIQKKDLERKIKDEIEIGYKQMLTAYSSLKKAENAYKQMYNFYTGIIDGYRKGRFNATAVKNALDALIQSEKGYNQSLINYNIVLVRYDFLRNKLFEKFNIPIHKILDTKK
ncbi:MAG: TolC family protein [Leptonema sp. (in: bacteria)]